MEPSPSTTIQSTPNFLYSPGILSIQFTPNTIKPPLLDSLSATNSSNMIRDNHSSSIQNTLNLKSNMTHLPTVFTPNIPNPSILLPKKGGAIKTPTLKSNIFSIFQLNIRSLPNHLDDLQTLLVQYNITPDIIGISETRLKTTSPIKPTIKGYNFINGIMHKDGPGGVGIFVKDNLQYKVVNKYNINIDSCEELWLEVLNPKGANMLIATIYRHPCRLSLTEFQMKFEEIVYKISKLNLNYFLIGDFNINLFNSSHSDYINTLLSIGCRQLVNFATHPNPVNNSLIDHIYTNCENKSANVTFIQEDISDHYPILLTLNNFKLYKKSSKYEVKVRNMKNFDQHKFEQDLHSKMTEFQTHIDQHSSDIDLLFTKFIQSFNSVIDHNAPVTTVSRKTNFKHKPWITKGILKSLNKKNKMFKGTLE